MLTNWKRKFLQAEKLVDELHQRNKDHVKDYKELQAKHSELKNKLMKEFDDERAIAFKKMELEFEGKMNAAINSLEKKHSKELVRVKDEAQEKLNKGIEENFTKLKESLSKLHEEGNANTKYLEKMSISIMENFAKSQRTALGYTPEEE